MTNSSSAPSPRVAEYGNPGLNDATPLGLATTNSSSALSTSVAEYGNPELNAATPSGLLGPLKARDDAH